MVTHTHTTEHTARLAAADAAVRAAASRRGLHLFATDCIHTPPVTDCAPCVEVALRLALDEIDEVRAEFA